MELEGVQFLAVTSNYPKTFKGKFHGVEYVWKPGDVVNMPVDAAEHIFGFGQDDKTKALHRAGFLNTLQDMDEAMEKLGMFSFAPVEQVFELTQNRRARKARVAARISDDRSPVTVDVSEGAVERPAPDDTDEDDEDDDDEAGSGAR
jgi:hypothetical protein